MMPFIIGNEYSRKDIYRIINVPPEKQEGNWNTGYTLYNNDYFVFVNINSPGRTGHNYQNRFIGSKLEWYGKKGSSINHNTIKKMLNPDGYVYIFTSENNVTPYFVFRGNGIANEYFDESPVKIIWRF